ncbi:hypothetical protein H0H92_001051 [Tricholoma furcatifolium]|nr:hypothetical protein H0H92_001051 [Tricholoma furcatifolium]
MANISPMRDRSDDEEPQRSKTASKSSKADEPAMEVDELAEDEEEDEEEYEIEKILDSKRGAFPEGRMGYFVKWKGYPESENSWVDEQDAGNAQSLIDDYWKRVQKKPSAKKQASRKSIASDDVESVSAPVKKRGRPSLADARAKESISDTRTTKKTKKNGVTSQSVDDDEVVIGNMQKHMDVANWESLVKAVDTVEQAADGQLLIYFTLNNGDKVCENSKLAAQRFPQKHIIQLIQFYEGNLRWKTAAD